MRKSARSDGKTALLPWITNDIAGGATNWATASAATRCAIFRPARPGASRGNRTKTQSATAALPSDIATTSDADDMTKAPLAVPLSGRAGFPRVRLNRPVETLEPWTPRLSEEDPPRGLARAAAVDEVDGGVEVDARLRRELEGIVPRVSRAQQHEHAPADDGI